MSKLTKRSVEALAPRAKDYIVWDKDVPGFGVRVMPSGRRSFVLQYRVGHTFPGRETFAGDDDHVVMINKCVRGSLPWTGLRCKLELHELGKYTLELIPITVGVATV